VQSIPDGYSARVSFVVSQVMTVDFDELGPGPDLYATYWMAKHMEEAGRKIILPFLDDDEDGVGRAVSVTHLAPAAPGTLVHVDARLERTEGNRVFASQTATTASGKLLGEGTTEQVVLAKSRVEEMCRDAAGRAGVGPDAAQSPDRS
jgi:fluoroacetyl-CoA thioesterase